MSSAILQTSRLLQEKISNIFDNKLSLYEFVPLAKSLNEISFAPIEEVLQQCALNLNTWTTFFCEEEPLAGALMSFMGTWDEYFQKGIDNAEMCRQLCNALPQSIFGVWVDEYVQKATHTMVYWNLYECLQDQQDKWPKTLEILKVYTTGSDVALAIAKESQRKYMSINFSTESLSLSLRNMWQINPDHIPVFSHKSIVILYKMLRHKTMSEEFMLYNTTYNSASVRQCVQDILRKTKQEEDMSIHVYDVIRRYLSNCTQELAQWKAPPGNYRPYTPWFDFQRLVEMCQVSLQILFSNTFDRKSIFSFGADGCFVWENLVRLSIAVDLRVAFTTFFRNVEFQIRRRLCAIVDARGTIMYMQDLVCKAQSGIHHKALYEKCPILFYPATVRESLHLSGPLFEYVDFFENCPPAFLLDDPMYHSHKKKLQDALCKFKEKSTLIYLQLISGRHVPESIRGDVHTILHKLKMGLCCVNICRTDWLSYIYKNIKIDSNHVKTFSADLLLQ